MESVIVGTAVGVIVGLASNWLTFKFARWQRREMREEDRHRELREMLETMLRLARAQASGLIQYEIAMINDSQIAGTVHPHLEQARISQIEYIRAIEQRHPSFLWRPWRIDDPPLLELAGRLQDANAGAGDLMGDLLTGNVNSGRMAVPISKGEDGDRNRTAPGGRTTRQTRLVTLWILALSSGSRNRSGALRSCRHRPWLD